MQAVKFTFDSLLHDDKAPAPVAKVRMVSETEVDAARAAAFEEGRAAGRIDAETAIERSLVMMLEEVASGTARLMREIEGEMRATKVEAAGLAIAVARKLSGRLLARAPLAEIEALLTESLADHADEPRIVVRLDENLVEPMRQRLDTLLARQPFAGRIILIGEAGFAGADCRIEWPDGGIERRVALIDAAVDAAFDRFTLLSDRPAQSVTSES